MGLRRLGGRGWGPGCARLEPSGARTAVLDGNTTITSDLRHASRRKANRIKHLGFNILTIMRSTLRCSTQLCGSRHNNDGLLNADDGQRAAMGGRVQTGPLFGRESIYTVYTHLLNFGRCKNISLENQPLLLLKLLK